MGIVIDYIILENVPRSDQEHFNQLNQESNRLILQDNQLHWQFNRLQEVITIFSINSHLVFSLSTMI